MMKCAKCRTENAADALYCKMCAASMNGGTESVLAAPAEDGLATIEVAPDASFAVAATASTIAAAYPRSESAADFARYQRKLADKADQVKDAKEAAGLAAADHELYRRRRRNCLVVGIVLVALFAFAFPSWSESFATSMEENSVSSLASNFFLFSLGALNAFLFPFGFTPIKNFVVNNGFFIVAGWLFLALAALALVVLSMLLGIPYAIWLNWKVSKSRKNAEEAVEFARLSELEYQSM